MNRPRDRRSAAGLLPRMEARPWRDGVTVTYRYHPFGAAPVNLGTDRQAAIQRVLDMLGEGNDAGTFRRLWAQYQDTPDWRTLQPRTQADYTAYAVPLLRVFGDMRARDLTAPMVARYLRVERAGSPVRANREMSLLSLLCKHAIERGEAEFNPCTGKQVSKNKERPRPEAPSSAALAALVEYASTRGPSMRVVVLAAEFAALAGSRQGELLRLYWPAFDEAEVRLERGKQRRGEKRVERVEVSPALLALRGRLQEVAKDGRVGAVFPNRLGNPYTSSGFAAMWQRLMRQAVADGVVSRRFTFHDLRAHYTTEHKATTGALPDLHASPTTTAKVYERSRVARRKSL